jgi:hypothetical protein
LNEHYAVKFTGHQELADSGWSSFVFERKTFIRAFFKNLCGLVERAANVAKRVMTALWPELTETAPRDEYHYRHYT